VSSAHFAKVFSAHGAKVVVAARRTDQMDEIPAPFMPLASDAGSFINGVALPVDGAHSIGNM